MSLSHFRVA